MDGERDGQRRVIGLCAQWCGVCREWRAAFDAAAAAHPQDHFEWIDVEDEADLMGDIDIETFPSLLVGRADRVLFFGTVLPKAEMLTRLLASLDADAGPGTPQARALMRRIASRQL
ncbi:MAG: thioredoxin [Burkholderiales bacterium]|nr:thioredoxin [Burkholderiales bacterium]